MTRGITNTRAIEDNYSSPPAIRRILARASCELIEGPRGLVNVSSGAELRVVRSPRRARPAPYEIKTDTDNDIQTITQ